MNRKGIFFNVLAIVVSLIVGLIIGINVDLPKTSSDNLKAQLVKSINIAT